MAMRPFDNRYWPIQRSDRSFFEPSWDLGLWQDFGIPRPLLEDRLRQQSQLMPSGGIEDRMRDMERQMQTMFRSFSQLMPVPTLPAQGGRNPIEQMGMENPYVTDRDGNRKFQLHFDVRQFKPEEIQVKTENRQLSVHARHEEKGDQSQVYREYQRSYLLPETLQSDKLSSVLSPEGVLTIEAPLPAIEAPKEKTEVHIPIMHK